MTLTDDELRAQWEKLGSIRAIARETGIPRSTIQDRVRRLGIREATEQESSKAKRFIVIPDCQVKPDVPLSYLTWIGRYVADQEPDHVVCLGDFADMPSLSSYDRGKRKFEGRRYKKDVEASLKGMRMLTEHFKGGPKMDLVYGNHEHRITRAANDQPEYDGLISLDDLRYTAFGWNVHDFLKPIALEGVVFSHYLVSGVMGRPITTANAILTKCHQSAIVGHQQGRQVAYARKANGDMLTAIIAGSAYPHEEDYLGPQGNKHWRGIIVLNEVREGQFDEMFVSLNFLERKYGPAK